MADLTITAANVVQTAGDVSDGTAGGTITAGMPLYKDAADLGHLKAAADTSATVSACVGIALHGASDGQPLKYARNGSINLGATLTVGMPYVVSAAGLIAPIIDGATGDFITVLGIATTASNLSLQIHVGGIALAADIT